MRLAITAVDGRTVPIYGHRLIERVLENDPCTVTDVGVGFGVSSKIFLHYGFSVTGISLREGLPSNLSNERYTHVRENLFTADVPQADIVWASMIIEHMPNVGLFLERCKALTKPGGLLCIVAPTDPMSLLVDGHLSFWTPAHLLFNMVHAGIDCSEAEWYTQGRDIGLLVKRKDRTPIELNYDNGDFKLLQPYLPVEFVHRRTDPRLPDNWSYDESRDHRERPDQP